MKNKAIILLSIALGVILFLYLSKDDTIKEVTKIEVKYDTIIKTIDNTKPTEIKKVFITTHDTIFKNDTIKQIIFKDKLVNQYKYVDSLKNGIINSIILADTIYKRNITLQTFNKETTIKTVKTVAKSSIYVGGIITSDLNKSIHNASINGYFTYKNKFLINTGIGMDIQTSKMTINVGFAIPF